MGGWCVGPTPACMIVGCLGLLSQSTIALRSRRRGNWLSQVQLRSARGSVTHLPTKPRLCIQTHKEWNAAAVAW